jgi:hypothetical protein
VAVAPTQDALYSDIDLELSWSERDLPERERTKHVHRLHPYLGKFAGSGTTLVQGLESGFDAMGADIAAFNCLLMRVKTHEYNLFVLESEVRDALARLEAGEGESGAPTEYIREWFAPQSVDDLIRFRSLLDGYEHADVLRVVLARAARSARLTPHFDLDFPRSPQRGEYWCHKHRRVCRPVERAAHFLRRYALDTVRRIKDFSRVRARGCEAGVLHGDSRDLAFEGPFDGLVTSPPYPGLIDYHGQHRYAYELLALDELNELELGSAVRGTSVAALTAYSEGIAAAFANTAASLRPGAPVVIVINDRRDLYPEILERAGFRLDERYRRHVNRRTGRRAGEFYEDVLVARAG